MRDQIVSSESEELILVDEADNEIGFLSKAECHDGDGRLHRAFSVFLFDTRGRLLLQQRGSSKRLWPGFWSNSCCSHPRRGETMEVATMRRLQEELGVDSDLEFVYKFSYHASFGEPGSENELCSVFLGRCTQEVLPNMTEIDAIRFVSADDLATEMDAAPEHFTPWFKKEWMSLINEHYDVLGNYIAPLN